MSFPRYERYKDSEYSSYGAIPADWREVRLKTVLSQRITDGPHETPAFTVSGVPFLSVDGIQAGELVFEGCRYISQEAHALYARKVQPKRDDILLAKAASTGKVARVKTDIEFNIWSPLAVIRLASDRALPAFVEYVLQSPQAQAQIDNLCTANTQKNISMDDIPLLFFTLPSMEEQMSIVEFLSRETAKIDGLIEEQRRLIELLKEKRQAVISHAVTKGLNPNAPMKDSGMEVLGKIPSHWNCGPLKHFAKVIDCKHVTVEFVDTGRPIVSIRELKNDRIELNEAKLANEEEWEFLREGRVPATGDLIICRNASVGAVGEVTSGMEFCMGQDVCLIRPSIPGGFDFFTLISGVVRQQIDALLVGATIRRLNVEAIRGLIVADPPKGERSEIAQYLNLEVKKCDALETEAIGAIGLLQERRSALISAAVTGKIDVRGIAQ